MKAIVTVLGRDRVGIIASVCALLSEYNINILDISQTILEQGYFTMVRAGGHFRMHGILPGDRRQAGRLRHRARPCRAHPAGGHLQRHAPHLRGGPRHAR